MDTFSATTAHASGSKSSARPRQPGTTSWTTRLDGFGGDVYVLDFDDTDHPYSYCVILFSSEQGWPGYLYTLTCAWRASPTRQLSSWPWLPTEPATQT
jgi:hypothetical protein